MLKATIIDYGIGNILSVKRAFEYFGLEVCITDSEKEIVNAGILVLPGVGAFADGMNGLKEKKLVEAILKYAEKKRPFLGICLGMQMMLDESEEFGRHQGIGLIPGKVTAIENSDIYGASHKIPHIGWNELKIPRGKDEGYWENSILHGINDGESVYFVHSFTAVPTFEGHRLADSYYGGRLVSAVIKKDNLYGCQFHPEKSGQIGLKMIGNFIQLGKDMM